ncbi:MAG: class I SAM-dependent methyltransferase [Neisseriaceae bacterium]
MLSSNLFHLTDEELDLTNKLSCIIREEIDNSNGSIPFSKYMELALYHKEFGYYNNLLFKFGSAGDFVTAPLVSELFAKCLSNQVTELFSHVPIKNILEIGAGNGQLMLDILSNIGDTINYYYILDLSANLTNLQYNRLKSELPQYINKVKWLNSLPNNFEGIIIGNEVLDAQPCESYIIDNGELFRREVAYANDQFYYVSKLLNDCEDIDYIKRISLATDNYIIDINMNNRWFIKSIAQCLNKGCAIFVDYGYGQREFYSLNHSKGTIRGFFRQQQLDDVLIYPGLIDITSSVNFTSIAEAAVENGIDLIDYTSQGAFLINCGILDYVGKTKDTLEQLQLSNQVNRLISPNEMGQIFKVIGFSKNVDFRDWIGFKDFSLSYSL